VTLDVAHACVVDLDGVVWLAGQPLEGAAEGVALLRAASVPVLFVTNNSAPTVSQLLERLERAGIPGVADEVVSSAMAAAAIVGDDQRVLVVGAAGLLEALDERGATIVEAEPDCVVVGWTEAFDYEMCDRAARAIRGGARFIATNLDPTHPTPSGLRPGTGAIVAAVATAAEREPVVAGKPSSAMRDLVLSRSAVGAVIGDRAATDGAFAESLGVAFAHVASDVDASAPGGARTFRSLLDAVSGLLA
jgi:4-nitrophenyl phosphatase